MNEKYMQAMTSLERFIETKIEVNGYTFQEEVVSVTVTEMSQSEDRLSIGEVIPKRAEITLQFMESNAWTYVTEATELTVYTRVNGLPWVKIGKFYPSEIERVHGSWDEELQRYNTMRVEIDAYDILNSLDRAITSTGDIRSVCGTELANMGITLLNVPTDSWSAEYQGTENYSLRTLLGYTAGLYGKNVRATPNGDIEFYWLNDTDFVIGLDEQYDGGVTLTGEKVQINGLVMGADDTEESVNHWQIGTDDMIVHTNPYATESIVQSVYDLIKGIEYYPCEMKFRGNLFMHSGDIVSVVDTNGEVFKTVVSEMTTVLTGMNSNIISKWDSKASEVGSVENVQANLSVNGVGNSASNRFKKIIAQKAEIDDIRANYISFGSAVGNKIQVDLLTALQANIKNGYTENSVAKMLLANALMAKDVQAENIVGSDLEVYDRNGNRIHLNGATQTFIDSNGRVRIVLGNVNADNDYDMVIYDKNGNELFNAVDGIQYDGLKNRIAETLNSESDGTLIRAKRLDLNAIVRSINGEDVLTDENGNPLYIYMTEDGELTDDPLLAVKDADGKPIEYPLYETVTDALKGSSVVVDLEEQSIDILFNKYAKYLFGSETLNEIITQSTYNFTNGLMSMLISSVDYDGENFSSFTMSDKAIELISEAINLTGLVTFESLRTPGQTVIDGGLIQVGTIPANVIETGAFVTSDSYESDKTATDRQITDINSEMSERRNSVKIDSDGVTIQDSISPQFSVNINAQRMAFKQGNTNVASISNNELNISNANVSGILRFGSWQFEEINDELVLKYVG